MTPARPRGTLAASMNRTEGRCPTAKDWAALSARWQSDLDERISRLRNLRDDLTNCIGCGCLSLDSCPLYNPGDKLSREGPGPRLFGPASRSPRQKKQRRE